MRSGGSKPLTMGGWPGKSGEPQSVKWLHGDPRFRTKTFVGRPTHY